MGGNTDPPGHRVCALGKGSSALRDGALRAFPDQSLAMSTAGTV